MTLSWPQQRPRWITSSSRASEEPNLPMMRRLWPWRPRSLPYKDSTSSTPSSVPLLRRERRRETKVKVVRKARSGKTRRTRQTSKTRRVIRRASKCHPRKTKRRRNKLESTLTIGVSTIWHGQSTNLLTASWARSTRTTRRRTATRPTLPSSPQRPPPPSALIMATLANMEEE
jgi:hypothetical protein